MAACGISGPDALLLDGPPAAPPLDPAERNDVEGCNCAGASPALTADDGVTYPFQSVVAYHYRVLEAQWEAADGQAVLELTLPPHLYAHEAFFTWLSKSVQIYAEPGVLGFAHARYYRGAFGRMATPPPTACSMPLDEDLRLVGMLAHVALSQAGECGTNDDGTSKFWQVNRISLLRIGDVLDAYALVRAGLAAGDPVTEATTLVAAERCVLPAPGVWVDAVAPVASPRPPVPCRVAFRADAVTEGVVIPVPSPTTSVSGVPLVHRAFTAAGTEDMPGDLDEVRVILRDGQLRAMWALGLPRFVPAPEAGPTFVRLIGHRVGPAVALSPVLLADERAWIDGVVGRHQERCCWLECPAPAATVKAKTGAVVTTPVPEPACEETCAPEGTCDSALLGAGMVAMVSGVTTRECFGNCPEPASGAPAFAPSCSLGVTP